MLPAAPRPPAFQPRQLKLRQLAQKIPNNQNTEKTAENTPQPPIEAPIIETPAELPIAVSSSADSSLPLVSPAPPIFPSSHQIFFAIPVNVENSQEIPANEPLISFNAPAISIPLPPVRVSALALLNSIFPGAQPPPVALEAQPKPPDSYDQQTSRAGLGNSSYADIEAFWQKLETPYQQSSGRLSEKRSAPSEDFNHLEPAYPIQKSRLIHSNVGYELLKLFGWRDGEPLGRAERQGIRKPLEASRRPQNMGIGRDKTPKAHKPPSNTINQQNATQSPPDIYSSYRDQRLAAIRERNSQQKRGK